MHIRVCMFPLNPNISHRLLRLRRISRRLHALEEDVTILHTLEGAAVSFICRSLT
jgi:hypothetical protein